MHGDVHVAGVDAGQVDCDAQLVGLLGAYDVDARAEAPPRGREAGSVPELVEDLLELGVETLYVVTGRDGNSVPRRFSPK